MREVLSYQWYWRKGQTTKDIQKRFYIKDIKEKWHVACCWCEYCINILLLLYYYCVPTSLCNQSKDSEKSIVISRILNQGSDHQRYSKETCGLLLMWILYKLRESIIVLPASAISPRIVRKGEMGYLSTGSRRIVIPRVLKEGNTKDILKIF